MGLQNRGDIPWPVAYARIGGRDIPVRDIGHKQANRLIAAFPPIAPPLGPDPRKGGLAPPIPRHDDPEYVRTSTARRIAVRCAEIACALGWEDAKGRTLEAVPDGEVLEWAKAAREWLETEWTDGEALAFSIALDKASRGEGGSDEAPGKD